jgi:hypothetical protein
MRDIHFHQNSPNIERYAPHNFPIHVASHKITGSPPIKYCQEHAHHRCYELNLVLPSSNGLSYEIGIDGDRHIVNYPSAVWLPPGILHSANALTGSGWFVCIRLPLNLEISQ